MRRNARNTDAIAEAIEALKWRFRASKVIVAGHSGGAAITANILGRDPGLIDAALLVSCPRGDVNRWRASMLRLTNIPVFKGNIDSLSPIRQIKGISARVPTRSCIRKCARSRMRSFAAYVRTNH